MQHHIHRRLLCSISTILGGASAAPARVSAARLRLRRSMAIPVARVHLKVAHAALPALLRTPPKWKMLPLLPTPPPCIAAVFPKPAPAKPSRADSDERWDAHKAAKPACPASSALSSPRTSATSSPPRPGRADSVERWDANKKAAVPSSSWLSSSGTSSLVSSSSKWPISRSTSAERWDVHKKCCPPPQADQRFDDGESSSTGSNDIDDTEEEEILWKPPAMYAGPGFVGAAPEHTMLPMPTSFLVCAA